MLGEPERAIALCAGVEKRARVCDGRVDKYAEGKLDICADDQIVCFGWKAIVCSWLTIMWKCVSVREESVWVCCVGDCDLVVCMWQSTGRWREKERRAQGTQSQSRLDVPLGYSARGRGKALSL